MAVTGSFAAAGWAMRIADLTESGALSEFALGWGGVLTT